MYKCRICKTTYLNKFCPNCGAHFSRDVIYPSCCLGTSFVNSICEARFAMQDVSLGEVEAQPYKIPAGFDVLSCGLEFEESGKGYVVSGVGVCKASRISIPSSFKGKPVTGIAEGAFKYCTQLADVEVPVSVTSVSAFAFFGCSALTKVTLPSLKSLGNHAFGNCQALSVVEFLGDEDKWAKLGKGIGNEALGSANKTYLDLNHETGVKEDAKPAAPAKASLGKKTAEVPASGALPDVPSTETGAKKSSGLRFEERDYGYVLKSMGTCKDTEVVIPSVRSHRNVVGIADAAFKNKKFLKSVKIPYGVTFIGADAFWFCSSLVHVDIPDSVTKIGSGAFFKCESLERIDIPKSVKTIGDIAFLSCDRLSVINYHGTEKEWTRVNVIGDNDKLLETVRCVGDKTETKRAKIAKSDSDAKTEPTDKSPTGAAYFTSGLEFSFFGKTCSVKDAGKCNDEIVVMPSDVDGMPVAGIESEAFFGRNEIRAVCLPHGVTYIGTKAFADCSSLAFVNIPETVIAIRNGAFSGCTSLVTVLIPKSVTTIGTGAFDGCASLREINYLGSREDWEKIKLGRFDRTDVLRFLGR